MNPMLIQCPAKGGCWERTFAQGAEKINRAMDRRERT